LRFEAITDEAILVRLTDLRNLIPKISTEVIGSAV
jgi:hypothetical protein